MNRGQMRTLTSQLCEDPRITKFTATQYNDALDHGQRQFAMDSKAVYTDFAITMASGTAAYPLPDDFMYEKEVKLNGLKLKPISRASLETIKISDRWDDDEGVPKYFIIDPEKDRETITLYPKPNTTADGTALVLTYYFIPYDMSDDSATPFNYYSLMDQFHMAVCHYAAWLLLSYLPNNAEISDKRSQFYTAYQNKVSEAQQTFGNTVSESMQLHVEDITAR